MHRNAAISELVRASDHILLSVSLTSIVCKLMESIIRDSVTTHFKLNHLLSNGQFGFIKGRSTSLQLLQILDKWTELLENGGQIDLIYTDLKPLTKYHIRG